MADVANAESLTEQASGSVGNATFGRNQHGPWVRTRATPADPNTVLQQAVRAHLATCVTAWNATLTQPERATWDRYALACLQASLIGRQTNAGGIGMYIRSNVPRLQAAEASLPRVDVAPSLFDLGPHTPITRVVLNVVNDTLHVFFALPDAWRTEPGAALLFYASPPQVLTRHFWKGPYRYAAPILGRLFPSPKSPATLPLPFPAAATERVFVRYRLTRADGRLSSSVRLPADHLPQVAPQVTAVSSQFVFPTLAVFIDFDHLLEPGPLASAPWTVRFGDFLWNPGLPKVLADRIQINCTRGPFAPGADAVTYAPPPADVIALLTGIPAAGFTHPIPWP